jgi:hypothetical protein
MFENGVLRRIFGTEREEVARRWGNCMLRIFITCIFHIKEDMMGRSCSTHEI